jgi:hypothetical protein
VPIFPELRPYLLNAFGQASEGAEYVIARYRHPNANLRTQLQRIIRKAGLEAWPKLFHNLRATRQTELCETYPTHVVCAWIGNSAAVAAEHYLQVTDEHFAQAVKDEPTPGSADGGKNAAQNQAQYAAGSSGNDQDAADGSNEKRPELPGDSRKYRSLQHLSLPPRGVEPLSSG